MKAMLQMNKIDIKTLNKHMSKDEPALKMKKKKKIQDMGR